MPQISNEEFITRLTDLYESSSSSGSVYLTSKRLTHPSALASQDAQGDTTMTTSPSSSSSSHPLLFRASNGKDTLAKKSTFSTVVSPTSLPHFQSHLLQPALRNQASLYLRKRDKAKERKVDKALATRRRKDEELGGAKGIVKVGSKRGKGHRVKQRAQKRALKLRMEEAIARSKLVGGTAGAANRDGDGDGDVGMGDAAATQTQQGAQNTSSNSAAASSSNKKKKKKGGKK